MDYSLEPFATESKDDVAFPPGSGGFLMALFQWEQFLVVGEKGFKKEFIHGGTEPFFCHRPPKAALTMPSSAAIAT